jgi:hypothetical protein
MKVLQEDIHHLLVNPFLTSLTQYGPTQDIPVLLQTALLLDNELIAYHKVQPLGEGTRRARPEAVPTLRVDSGEPIGGDGWEEEWAEGERFLYDIISQPA